MPPPNLETRVSDLQLVLETVGSERPVLAGINEAGAPNVVFAATQPERVRSIAWLEPFPRVVWAPDFPWGVKHPYVEREESSLDLWDTNDYGEAWAEAEAATGMTLSSEQRLMAGMMSRHTGTPDVARKLDVYLVRDRPPGGAPVRPSTGPAARSQPVSAQDRGRGVRRLDHARCHGRAGA